MRRFFHGFVLVLTVTAGALLAHPAQAQGTTLDYTQWTDPSHTYLVTVGEGVAVNPPAGGGTGAWLQYQANVTYRDGSPLVTYDADGNLLPVTYTLTVWLHGAGSYFNPFQVEFTYAIRAGGLEDTGVGHMVLSSDQQTFSGSYKDNLDGSKGPIVLLRVPPPPSE